MMCRPLLILQRKLELTLEEWPYYLAASIIALVILFFIIKNKRTERKITPFIGKFSWVPLIGSYIMSLSARADLEEREGKRVALSENEMRNKAKNYRKLLRRVKIGNQKLQTISRQHVYRETASVNEESLDKERAIKNSILMSTASHSRISNSSPPRNLSPRSLSTLQFFAYKFQTDEKYREPFLLEHMGPNKTKEEIFLSKFASELRSLSATASINFLIGSIGSGKSTVSAIIEAEIYRQVKGVDLSVPVKVVSVDFEEIVHRRRAFGREAKKESFVDYVFDRLKAIIGSKVSENSLEEHLNSSTRQKYIFIFDNLDIVYNEFCRYYFSDNDLKLSFFGHQSYLYCLRELIRIFSDLPTFASPIAPSVLFCLREDTMALLDSLFLKDGQPMLSTHFHVVKLSVANAPEIHFTRLITKRLVLAEDMINSTGIPPSFKAAMSKLRSMMVIDPEKYSEFVRLSVQGNRSAIQAFHRYFTADANTTEIATAMSDSHRVKCLALFNGHETYSQERANIANLFLVNSEYRIASEFPDQPVNFELSSYFHHHTYWLKYLVFSFIYCQNENAGSADMREIERVFCDLGGFDQQLVRLVIYSLTEVQHGRLIRPRVRHAHLSDRYLHMTSRGKEFAMNKLCVVWSMQYLATIIEDEWMELPKSIAEERMEFGSKVFWKERDYMDYLLDKVGAVTEMVYCLEIAFDFEKKLRPELFKYLENEGVLYKSIPDFEEVIEAIHEQAQVAAVSVPDPDFCAKIKSEIDKIRKSKAVDTAKIKEQLAPLYEYPVHQVQMT